MRIAELSRRSGVSVPTIKYYLREGLLPGGTSTGSPNQAIYDEAHLRRLRLIRALIDVGGLSVAATREVLAAVDDPHIEGHELLGVAHHAVAPPRRTVADPEAWQRARTEVEELVRRRGWYISPGAPALDQLTDVIAAMRALEMVELLAALDGYAEAAELVARHDLQSVAARAATVAPGDPQRRAAMVGAVVTGTVLGEAMLSALRRLAQENASARMTGTGPDSAGAGPQRA
jgi:DNA-binding transcriptional MerR regulator